MHHFSRHNPEAPSSFRGLLMGLGLLGVLGVASEVLRPESSESVLEKRKLGPSHAVHLAPSPRFTRGILDASGDGDVFYLENREILIETRADFEALCARMQIDEALDGARVDYDELAPHLSPEYQVILEEKMSKGCGYTPGQNGISFTSPVGYPPVCKIREFEFAADGDCQVISEALKELSDSNIHWSGETFPTLQDCLGEAFPSFKRFEDFFDDATWMFIEDQYELGCPIDDFELGDDGVFTLYFQERHPFEDCEGVIPFENVPSKTFLKNWVSAYDLSRMSLTTLEFLDQAQQGELLDVRSLLPLFESYFNSEGTHPFNEELLAALKDWPEEERQEILAHFDSFFRAAIRHLNSAGDLTGLNVIYEEHILNSMSDSPIYTVVLEQQYLLKLILLQSANESK